MKRGFSLFVTLVVVTGIIISFTGCATSASGAVNFGHIKDDFGEQLKIPAKDFDSLGMVFTEVEFTISNGRINGEVYTYQALLKEAARVGADAIINVVIDYRIEDVTVGTSTTKRQRWHGSALAIRYTTMLTDSTLDEKTGNRTTSPVMNEPRVGGGSSGGGSSGETPSAKKGLFGLFGGK